MPLYKTTTTIQTGTEFSQPPLVIQCIHKYLGLFSLDLLYCHRDCAHPQVQRRQPCGTSPPKVGVVFCTVGLGLPPLGDFVIDTNLDERTVATSSNFPSDIEISDTQRQEPAGLSKQDNPDDQ